MTVVGQGPAGRFISAPYHRRERGVKGSRANSGTLTGMNEHDGLEPTVAMPRIDVTSAGAAPQYPPPQPIPPQPPVGGYGAPPMQGYAAVPVAASLPAGYRFGNPFGYALRRFLAFALDLALITSVSTMLLYGLIAINPFSGLPNNSEGGFDATFGMGVAIAFVYLWLFEAIFGTTLGKLAFSLQVYAPRHRFVGLGRSFIRNLLRPVDALVIGWILAIAPGHRRLGDLFGGTLVAHSPLRAFSPLVGWVLIIALGAVPFLVAGGSITVLAVAAAFVEFVPPLVAHAFHAVVQFGIPGVHVPASTG